MSEERPDKPGAGWKPLGALAIIAVIYLLGQFIYDRGEAAGRKAERDQLQLTCELARLGAEGPTQVLEAARICIDVVMSED